MGGLVGLLVGGVGYAWVAEGVLDPDTRWIWVPPLVLALAAALTLPGQIFSRHPAGVSILARTAAYILLAGYVVLSVMGSRQWSFPLLLFASSCMAGASALLLWPTLKPSMTFRDYRSNGVRGVHLLLVLRRWHAVGEGDGEGVQSWLPPHGPSCLTGALGV